VGLSNGEKFKNHITEFPGTEGEPGGVEHPCSGEKFGNSGGTREGRRNNTSSEQNL